MNTEKIKLRDDIDSSLNEIDIEMTKIMYKLLLIADPRLVSKNSDKTVWTQDRVFLVDELETGEIFNAFLISNDNKNIDITYPLCGICPKDITEVFYGTGNRFNQWNFLSLPPEEYKIKNGDEVVIIKGDNKGLKGIAQEIVSDEIYININNTVIKEDLVNCVDLNSSSSTFTFKAKQFKSTYEVAILVDNKKEARYIQDKFILRCADGHIWHPFNSPLLNGSESYIFTVFDIPNINRYPQSENKLKGSGYIYGLSFVVNVWAILADEPLPTSIIEQIRLNIHVENEIRVNKITIS